MDKIDKFDKIDKVDKIDKNKRVQKRHFLTKMVIKNLDQTVLKVKMNDLDNTVLKDLDQKVLQDIHKTYTKRSWKIS